MESKCHTNFRWFFMNQKEHNGPWLHLGESRGGDNPPGRARRPRRALVGCAHLGCPLTASLLYKYPKNPRTLEASTKYSSSRRRVQNHQIQSRHYLGDPYDVTLLRCVCWDLMKFEFMISYIFLYPWKYLSFFDLFYAWSLIASYFFSDIWVFCGQVDLFILQWEEVLCSGFDHTMLDPSDRKGTDTYASLLIRIKWWGLSLHR